MSTTSVMDVGGFVCLRSELASNKEDEISTHRK